MKDTVEKILLLNTIWKNIVFSEPLSSRPAETNTTLQYRGKLKELYKIL